LPSISLSFDCNIRAMIHVSKASNSAVNGRYFLASSV
jgi:hypothetical protein